MKRIKGYSPLPLFDFSVLYIPNEPEFNVALQNGVCVCTDGVSPALSEGNEEAELKYVSLCLKKSRWQRGAQRVFCPDSQGLWDESMR